MSGSESRSPPSESDLLHAAPTVFPSIVSEKIRGYLTKTTSRTNAEHQIDSKSRTKILCRDGDLCPVEGIDPASVECSGAAGLVLKPGNERSGT